MPSPRKSWDPSTLVVIDDEYDQENASDGHSRYGAYLSQRLNWLHDIDSPQQPLLDTEFAATAWRIATSPIMSPGYVRLRPDLLAVTTSFSEDGEEGRLLVDVQVPLRHHELQAARRIPYTWRDWQTDRESLGEEPYRALHEPEPTKPALLTTTVVRLVVDDSWRLAVQEHTSGRGLVSDAKRAVAVLASNINRHAGPMVAALRGERV